MMLFFDFWLIFDHFWINLGSKMAGPKLRKSVPDAFPTTKWTPKAVCGPYLERFWDRFGNILETFLTIFLSIFNKNWNKFLIKTMFVQIYPHPSVVPVSLPSVSIDALFSIRGSETTTSNEWHNESTLFHLHRKTSSTFLRSTCLRSLEIFCLEYSTATSLLARTTGIRLHIFRSISSLLTACADKQTIAVFFLASR